jgi:hypothetical protein
MSKTAGLPMIRHAGLTQPYPDPAIDAAMVDGGTLHDVPKNPVALN